MLPVFFLLVFALIPTTGTSASNDPAFAQQWALPRIGAPAAWSLSTGAGVRIGIVDTGVDLAHEDLAGKVVASTSCIGSSGDASKCSGSGQDDNGHGTHVAAIAVASKDNSKGMAGVAPDAMLVVAKVLSSDGSGNVDDINAGVKWVVDHGAKVVNLSLADPIFGPNRLVGGALSEGVSYAWTHGAVTVLAVGNSSLLGPGLGGSSYGDIKAIVVGATGPDDQVAAYSNPLGDAKWSIVAPGGAGNGVEADNILSGYWVRDRPNQYAYLAGTSMATAHVAGTAALLLARGAGQQQVVDHILGTADAGVSCGAGSERCRGRLDAARAVTQAAGQR